MIDMTCLATVREAIEVLKVSKEFLYKLPKDTPGVYRFGRAIRFNIEELKDWARQSE